MSKDPVARASFCSKDAKLPNRRRERADQIVPHLWGNDAVAATHVSIGHFFCMEMNRHVLFACNARQLTDIAEYARVSRAQAIEVTGYPKAQPDGNKEVTGDYGLCLVPNESGP